MICSVSCVLLFPWFFGWVRGKDTNFTRVNIDILYDNNFFTSRFLEFLNGSEWDQRLINVRQHDVANQNVLEIWEEVCRAVESNSAGFLSFLKCDITQVVDEFLNKLAVPNLVYLSSDCYLSTNSNAMKLSHDCLSTNQVLADVVGYLKWTDVAIVFDSTYSGYCLQDLVMKVSLYNVKSSLVKLTNSVSEDADTLSSIKKLQHNKVILLVNSNRLLSLSPKITLLGMFNYNWHWIIPSSDQITLPEVNISISSHVLFVKEYHESKDSSMFHQNLLSLKTFERHVHDALSIYESALRIHNMTANSSGVDCFSLNSKQVDNYNELREILKKTIFDGLMGHWTFDDKGFPNGAGFNVFSLSEKSNISVDLVATWIPVGGLQPLVQNLYLNTFTDFGNRVLTIGTQEAKPFVIKSIVNGSVTFSGFCFNILDELATRYKFRYRIVEPPDGMWGGPEPDGTWNGMVGMVMRGEIDFAIGPFTITSLREQVIDFTKPYMEDGAGIILRRPDEDANKIFQMFRPFTGTVWGCIAVATVVVGVLLYLVNKLSPYTAYNRKLQHSSPEEVSLSGNMWLIYGAFVEQGGVFFPTAISGRCILGFWWVFTILITSTYTANLAAFLTVTISEKPINSLKELSASSQYKPLVKSGTNLYSLFQEATTGIYLTIWNQMSGMPLVRNNPTALSLVQSNDYAFMTDRSQLEYLVSVNCSLYSLADEIFNTAGYGFVVPEHAPYLESFNYNIMRMQEAGLIEKWRMKWWLRSNKCNEPTRTSSAQTLGLDSLAGPFLIYASVTVLSVVCFVAEICIQYRTRGKKKHTPQPLCHVSSIKNYPPS